MSLENLRKEIDFCDQRLAEVFQERLALVRKIARLKKEKGLAFYDPRREEEILRGWAGLTQQFFQEVLRLSRVCQAELLFPYNIVFIGFMGTGKTAVGREVARQLGRGFFDLDQILQKRLGGSLREYFAQAGEKAFRQREKGLIRELAWQEGLVLACGGGAVLDPENVRLLRQKGCLVLLSASSETISERLKGDSSRPLLGEKVTLAKIEELQRARAPIYEAGADLTVATDNYGVEEVALRVLAALAQKE